MSLNPEIIRDQMNKAVERLSALGATDDEIAAAFVCGAVIAIRKDEPSGIPSRRLGSLLALVGDAWERSRR